MVQREVGERFAAAPGTAAYGVPSVLAQLACDVRVHRVDLAHRLPPGAERRLGARRARPHRPGGAARAARARARRVRAPPQGAGALARAGPGRGARRARPRARGAAGARPPGRRARRAPGAGGVPRAGGGAARDRAARRGAGEDQPLPLRGPDARRRPPRARDRLPVDRARRRGRARAAPACGSAMDRVVCPGVDGREPRRRWRCARFRARTGWDGAPVRLRIEKRIPVAAGMAGGSGRRGARPCGSSRAPRASTTTRCCARSPPSSAPTSPPRCARGATWRPAPASASTPLPPPRALRRARAPVARRAARPPTSTARPIAWACRATRPGSRPSCARSSTAAGDLPDELIVNDLEPAARALCPEIDDALAAARGAGADHALVCGSGPTVIGLFADLQGARGAAARLFGRDPRPIAVAPLGGDAVKPVWLVFAAAAASPSSSGAGAAWSRRCWPAARWSRRPRLRLRARPHPPPEPRAAARSTSASGSASGPTCSSARWPSSRPAPSSGSSRRARPRCCSAASSPARARSTSSR